MSYLDKLFTNSLTFILSINDGIYLIRIALGTDETQKFTLEMRL